MNTFIFWILSYNEYKNYKRKCHPLRKLKIPLKTENDKETWKKRHQKKALEKGTNIDPLNK